MEPKEKEQLQKWIISAQNGSQTDFQKLYEYSFPAVQAECRKILRTPADTEDGIQESYLKIYRNLKSLEHPETFLPWCRRIAHNVCVDYVISQQRKHGKDDYKPPVSEDQYEGLDRLSLEDPDRSPEEQAERRDNQERLQTILQTAMNEIPAQRALCLALYEQGSSQKEISQKLRIPVGTVKSNIHYAKQALRQKIEQIEREENIQIHGLALLPAGDHAVIRLSNPDNSSFIRAMESSRQKTIWKKLSSSLFPKSVRKTWPKILAVTLTVIVLAAGIGLSVSRTREQKAARTTRPVSISSSNQLSRQSYSLTYTGNANSFSRYSFSLTKGPSLAVSTAEYNEEPDSWSYHNDRGNIWVEYHYLSGQTKVVSEEQYQKDKAYWKQTGN